MLFVTTLTALPGKYDEATRLFRHPRTPDEVKIREFLGLFGKPDALIIFEAPNERVAAEFAVQFGSAVESVTSLAVPIEQFKWTR
jgi:uncharacterized protein with GYD domain